jgi:alpha-tubulin suppressor-like RCC1 family protein
MTVSRAWRVTGAIVITIIVVVIIAGLAAQKRGKAELPRRTAIPPSKVQPQLVSGWRGVLMLAPDGTLWTWGEQPADFGKGTATPRRIGVDSDWRQVAFHHLNAAAIKADGSLWFWGWDYGSSGQRGVATNMFATPTRVGAETNWAHVRVGATHCLALKQDGSLWAWGNNGYGQVGDGTTSSHPSPIMISSERWKSTFAAPFNSFALKADGTLWGWGSGFTFRATNYLAPTLLDSTSNWVSIAVYDWPLVALKSDGTLWSWIVNNDWNIARMSQLGTANDWREIYGGGHNFVARKTDGSWWASGNNGMGQLGLGNTAHVTEPAELPFRFEPWAFSIGGSTTTLLTGDGKLWTWGQQLGAIYRPPRAKAFKHALNRTHFFHFNTNDTPRFNLVPEKLWSVGATNAPAR